MPTALAYTYCSEADIQALLSSDGMIGRVDDDNDGTVDATPEQLYLDKAISWATSRINFYCLPLYTAASLADSWVVNEWCVILACHWLSSRRGNPPPGSFKDLAEQAIKDLELVAAGRFQVPEAGYREAAWPAWSNIRVDILYSLRKVRVERPISDQTPTTYPQTRDRGAEFMWWER